MEWNPNAHEIGLIGNYVLATEGERRPMISIGTSSDRIGTPPGPHCYYATFAKSFPTLRFGPYVSLNYSEFDRRFNLPFGATFGLGGGMTTTYMNDGRKSHLLLTYSRQNWTVSAIWVWFKRPGIAFSIGF